MMSTVEHEYECENPYHMCIDGQARGGRGKRQESESPLSLVLLV